MGIQVAMAQHLKNTDVEPCIFSMLCGIFAMLYTQSCNNQRKEFSSTFCHQRQLRCFSEMSVAWTANIEASLPKYQRRHVADSTPY